jgi:hypothetical protein
VAPDAQGAVVVVLELDHVVWAGRLDVVRVVCPPSRWEADDGRDREHSRDQRDMESGFLNKNVHGHGKAVIAAAHE